MADEAYCAAIADLRHRIEQMAKHHNRNWIEDQKLIVDLKEQVRQAEARAEQAEALLAMATEFSLEDGWSVIDGVGAPCPDQWALFRGLYWHSSYATRDEAFASYQNRTGGGEECPGTTE